jgi:cysteine-S-conjugate beta-lyase
MRAGEQFDFDTPIDRRATASEKWDRYAGRDIIPLWVADMDFRSPPAVIQALHQRVEHGVFGYTSPPSDLIATVVTMLQREYGWQVRGEWLVWLPGLVCGLNVACRAVGEPGDGVVTFTPVYPPFLSAPKLADRELVCVPLCVAGERWEMDLEALERAITPRTRLLLLCSPHNPVGRVWSREEQQVLLELAGRHDLVVCSDEIHAGLVLDEDKRHVPFAALSAEAARRTVTLHAPSKTYNIAGLGCSFAVIPDEGLRRSFRHAMAGIVPHVNLLGYSATLAAYLDGESWRQALLEYLRANRDLAGRAIAGMPGLKTWPVESTYLAWIDARGLGVADQARFFEEAGVGLSDGKPFGAPGFVRLNFGCPRTLLKKALERMQSAVSRNGSGG